MPGAKPRCYIASPLGFTEGGRAYYAKKYLPALAEVVDPVDPWVIVSEDDVKRAEAAGTLRDFWLSVGRGNFELISGCSMVVAYLEGQEVDSGTATEIGYAAASGKLCFGLRSDLRRAGEEAMAVNLQVETAIVASGGVIANSLDTLVAAISAAAASAPRA